MTCVTGFNYMEVITSLECQNLGNVWYVLCGKRGMCAAGFCHSQYCNYTAHTALVMIGTTIISHCPDPYSSGCKQQCGGHGLASLDSPQSSPHLHYLTLHSSPSASYCLCYPPANNVSDCPPGGQPVCDSRGLDLLPWHYGSTGQLHYEGRWSLTSLAMFSFIGTYQ